MQGRHLLSGRRPPWPCHSRFRGEPLRCRL